MFLNTTVHHTAAYNVAPNPDKQWILRHTEKMLPIHKRFTDSLMTKRLQTLQSVDDGIQKIVQTLSSTGQLDNTYIFFTSDHGYHLGQFGLVKGKAFPYEFDTHVPFFVRGPGIDANAMRYQPVLNIDLAPTFLEIARLQVPRHMDGKSFLGTFKNSQKPIRDAFLIERGKMSFQRYATVSNNVKVDVIKDSSSSSKRQKRLHKKMVRECRKEKYQFPCLQNQNWVCRKTKDGSLKIKPCTSNLTKRDCYCDPSIHRSMMKLIRNTRSITSPRYGDFQALGSIVVNLAAQISEQDRRRQESWLSSRSVVKTQIQQLRAQLNELKQIRKYLRMRRPAGLLTSPSSGLISSRNLFEETLNQLSRGCHCSNLVKRSVSSMDRDDRKLQRLHKKMKKQRRRITKPRVKKVSRKQDHCKADVKMNCFR